MNLICHRSLFSLTTHWPISTFLFDEKGRLFFLYLGRRVMGTSLYLRNHDFPKAYSKIAA
jgi:hypothetical protein